MRPIGLRVTSHKSRSEPSESRAARIADCENGRRGARTTMATRGAEVGARKEWRDKGGGNGAGADGARVTRPNVQPRAEGEKGEENEPDQSVSDSFARGRTVVSTKSSAQDGPTSLKNHPPPKKKGSDAPFYCLGIPTFRWRRLSAPPREARASRPSDRKSVV